MKWFGKIKVFIAVVSLFSCVGLTFGEAVSVSSITPTDVDGWITL